MMLYSFITQRKQKLQTIELQKDYAGKKEEKKRFNYQIYCRWKLFWGFPCEFAVIVLSCCLVFELCQRKSGTQIQFLHLKRFILHASHWDSNKVNMALCEKMEAG